MARYVFDLEADNLLQDLTKIHCLALIDVDTGAEYSFADQPGYGSIVSGLKLLELAQQVIGHNVVAFDLCAIEKLYPWFKRPEKTLDTLIAARLVFPDTTTMDQTLIAQGRLPAGLQGSHALEAWGYRLGEHKGSFGDKNDPDRWKVWVPEMSTYMVQDTKVTLKLLQLIRKKGVPPVALKLEHEARRLCSVIEKNGIPFDRKAAEALDLTLRTQQLDAERLLADSVGTVFVKNGTELTPKIDNKKRGYTAGAPLTKVAPALFNPGSRQMMTKVLISRYGWKPQEFTASGGPKLDDEVIKAVPLPENLKTAFANYLMLTKRIGSVSEGKNAWLKKETNGVIHASYNTQGTVTGRATHSDPNISQVPRVDNPWGRECRDLFKAPPGWHMVGSDLAGLELRMLAHELYKYDQGAYREIVLHGDVHTANQQAAGLPTRNAAKTFVFGFIYGAGDYLIGDLVKPTAEEAAGLVKAHKKLVARAEKFIEKDFGRKASTIDVATWIKGRLTKERFLRGLPALQELRDDLVEQAQAEGFIVGLDGRKVPIRSPHSVLNYALQGGGALVCKRWIIQAEQNMLAKGYRHGWDGDFVFNAWLHDELVMCCRPGVEEDLKEACKTAAVQAGEFFKLNVPIAADAKPKPGEIEHTWGAVH
jgi:DNA polymerase-1